MKKIFILLFFMCSTGAAQFSPELGGNLVVSFNGVNCGSCSEKVEESFKGIKGVDSVSVDVANKKIYIALDQTKTLSEDFIRKELTKFGYIYLSTKEGYNE